MYVIHEAGIFLGLEVDTFRFIDTKLKTEELELLMMEKKKAVCNLEKQTR